MISRGLFARTLLASTCLATGLGPLSIDDVDGDGCADLVMVTSIAGRQLMAVSSRDDRTLWIYTPRDSYSPTSGGAQGASFAVLCADRDGDGARDVAVAWTSRADGDVPEHALVAVHSSRTGRVLAWHSLPCSKDDRPGSLIEVGDLDGDSRPELLFGMPGFERKTGIVYALSGVDLTAREFARGTRMGEEFGFALQPLGDVDGDGVDDVAIGRPCPKSGEGRAALMREAAIIVVSGRTSKSIRVLLGRDHLSEEHDWTLWKFGRTFAAAQQRDPKAPSNLWVIIAVDGGAAADLILISSSTGEALERVHLADLEMFQAFELQLASVGDWDGDGLGDVLLRHPSWDRLGYAAEVSSNEGQVRIVGIQGELDRWAGRRPFEFVGRAAVRSIERDASNRPQLWMVARPDGQGHLVVSRYARGERDANHSLTPTRNDLPEVPR